MSILTDRLRVVSDKVSRAVDIMSLISRRHLKRNGDILEGDGFKVYTVYSSSFFNMVIGVYAEKCISPLHVHDDCVQHLIVVQGKFKVGFDSNNSWQTVDLKAGQSVTIRPKVPHRITALVAPSQMVGIQVPPEKGYEYGQGQHYTRRD